MQAHFTHIALALVMALAQNMYQLRLVLRCAISEPSHQARVFFSGRHDHLIIQESLPFFLQSYPAEMYLTLINKCDSKNV